MGENNNNGMKYNMKNPGVKRILQELKEMQSNPSHDFMSLPLEENIFEWQFAIRGAVDTEFEGGIYHGRIQLPADYPFKPPSFMLLTPNGRFETQTKICLSISNHHPEHWQPSWSVRTALVALIAFMPTNPNGALGSLDYKKDERRILAIKSRHSAPTFGTPDRQHLIDQIHEYMLSKAPPVPELNSSSSSSSSQVLLASTKEEEVSSPSPNNKERGEEETIQEGVAIAAPAAVEGSETQQAHVIVEEQQQEEQVNEEEIIQEEVAAPLMIARPEIARQAQHMPRRVLAQRGGADDRIFTWAALGLTIAILVLLLKKFIKATGYGAALFMDGS